MQNRFRKGFVKARKAHIALQPNLQQVEDVEVERSFDDDDDDKLELF